MSAFNNIKWGEDKEMSMSVGSVQEKICLRSNWEVWSGTSISEDQAAAEKEPSDHGQSARGGLVRLIKAI